MKRDIRNAFRMLAARPGFTLAASAMLAAGIGANSAIFSLVNSFLFKPLQIEQPGDLRGVYSRNTKHPDYRAFSYPDYADLRAQNLGVFTSLAAHNMAMVGVARGDATERVFADLVTANFFATLGAPLFRGRVFTQAEEQPGSGIPVAIVSHTFWRKHGADPEFIGKKMRINGNLYTVVGITAPGFTGITAMLSPALFLPMGMHESLANDFDNRKASLALRDNHSLYLIGRLRPGMTQEAADRQLAVAAARLQEAYPAENKDQTFIARPLSRMSVSTSPSSDNELMIAATMLLSMSGIVLLIASLNVANMMLARGAARRKEIAVRLALGGGRGDIIRQLFFEGMALAVLGGAVGLAVSSWSTTLLIRSLERLAPLDLVYQAAPDWRVLLATLAFCMASTVLFAVWPAWNLSRPDLVSALKDGGYDFTGGKPARLLSRRNLLVMGQVALTLMLLTAAGLFVRSSLRASGVQPGFRMEGVALAELDPALAGYDETRGRQSFRAVLDRVRAIPGVSSAALAATVPFGMVSLGRSLERTSDPHPTRNGVECRFNIASDRYFETLDIPLLRGRTFTQADAGSPSRVVIVDQEAADKLWPDGSALGRHVRMVVHDREAPREAEIVGIVGKVKDNVIGGGQQPHMYVPLGQEYQSDMHLHLRVANSAVMDAVRQEIRAVDARLPLLQLRTMRDHLDASFDLWIVRTGARLFAILACVALLLAMVGLYGVRAYTVACRTREIGIRMALGSNAGTTLWMVLREGLVLSAVGSAVGLALSLGVGKVLASFLYEVSGLDALVFTAAPLLLGAVSLLACYIPARRASRVDPMVALRYE
jgi:predicted permease